MDLPYISERLNLQVQLVCPTPLSRKTEKTVAVRLDRISLKEYHGIQEEDKAFMTLYSMTDKFSYLVGKKRKEATQQEKRQLAKQFLTPRRLNANHGLIMKFFDLVDMRKTKSKKLRSWKMGPYRQER